MQRGAAEGRHKATTFIPGCLRLPNPCTHLAEEGVGLPAVPALLAAAAAGLQAAAGVPCAAEVCACGVGSAVVEARRAAQGRSAICLAAASARVCVLMRHDGWWQRCREVQAEGRAPRRRTSGAVAAATAHERHRPRDEPLGRLCADPTSSRRQTVTAAELLVLQLAYSSNDTWQARADGKVCTAGAHGPHGHTLLRGDTGSSATHHQPRSRCCCRSCKAPPRRRASAPAGPDRTDILDPEGAMRLDSPGACTAGGTGGGAGCAAWRA